MLGTGIMGAAMARYLVAAGLRTTVWDRSTPATAALSGAGARTAASPGEAVRDAQVVITMLPTADVVNSAMIIFLPCRRIDCNGPGRLRLLWQSGHCGA